MAAWHKYRTLPRADRGVARWAITLNIVLNATIRVSNSKRAYAISEFAGRLPRTRPGRTDVGYAAHVAGLVNHVSNRFPARSACLVRSMTLRSLLLRNQVNARLMLGTKRGTGGVVAHAWVEVDGTPINDAADIGTEYAGFELAASHWNCGTDRLRRRNVAS